MDNPRFFVEGITANERVNLMPDDARHAINVLRLRAGNRVTLFDGHGWEAAGEIVSSVKSQVAVRVETVRRVCREVPKRLELFVSLPKGDRQKQLIDMLVQLGVYSLTPLVCRRSIAQPTDNAIDRLRRVVIETSKQCCRNHLMDIQQPMGLNELTHGECDSQGKSLCLFAHPHGDCVDLRTAFCDLELLNNSPARVLIGPEGGFTDDEVRLLSDSGWCQVHLGQRVLRIETAAIAVAAAWAIWHDQAARTNQEI